MLKTVVTNNESWVTFKKKKKRFCLKIALYQICVC